jgi:hypothetical protein
VKPNEFSAATRFERSAWPPLAAVVLFAAGTGAVIGDLFWQRFFVYASIVIAYFAGRMTERELVRRGR